MKFVMNMELLQKQIILLCVSITATCACAQNSRNDTARLVFQDRVEPHWFAGADGITNQFWYRINLPGGKSQIITVNAQQGTREIAPTNFIPETEGLPVLRFPRPSG